MKSSFLAASVVAATLFSSLAFAHQKAHWGYQGHAGPEHWGQLSPEFTTCSKGKNQSPVDLSGMVEAKLPALKFAYLSNGQEVLNNGHTVQVNYQAGSELVVGDHHFELKQFHFHSPSENTIKGESFPLEAHFVHADKEGNLAVIGLMFREGEANKELAKAWHNIPTEGHHHALGAAISAEALLPVHRDYYRFTGSLTTPPCSEGVTWMVMKEAQTASAQQIHDFTHAMHHANNRPVQPVNARVILK